MSEKDEGLPSVRDYLSSSENYRYIYSRLLPLALKKGLARHEAEDFVQQSLFRAWQHESKYVPRPGKPLISWILAIAQNVLVDLFRKLESERQLARDFTSRGTPRVGTISPEDALLLAEARRNRWLLLGNLSSEVRRQFIVVAQQRNGTISRQEAADRLGISIPELEAARKRLKRIVLETVIRLGLTASDFVGPRIKVSAPAAKRQEDPE